MLFVVTDSQATRTALCNACRSDETAVQVERAVPPGAGRDVPAHDLTAPKPLTAAATDAGRQKRRTPSERFAAGRGHPDHPSGDGERATNGDGRTTRASARRRFDR